MPAGKAGGERVDRIVGGVEPPLDVRDDVHHVAVAFDAKTLRHHHGADRGDPADIVAAEVEQHQVLGAFLLVRQQVGRQRLVFGRRPAPRARAGDGADGYRAAAHPHEDLGARANDLERAEVEVAERNGAGLTRRSAR